MSKYVMIICKNCGKIQLYTEEYYKLHYKKPHFSCVCGNGRLIISMKEVLTVLKNDFENMGLHEFKERQLFDVYEKIIKKNIDKGFEILKVEDKGDN